MGTLALLPSARRWPEPPLPETPCDCRGWCGECGECLHGCDCLERLRDLRDRLKRLLMQRRYAAD